MPEPTGPRLPRGVALGILLLALAAAAWLRARGIGHLLMWDEAFDLCSVRAYAAGGKDFFSSHFWYHPPAFKVLMLAAAPLAPGFAERSQLLAIAVSLASMLVLYALNRRVYGENTALLSAAVFALLPGAVFYDAWIKGGGIVQVCGLAALLFFARRRYVLCGMLLGFAMLDKETGLFYAMACGLLWLLSPALRWNWKIAAAVAGSALAAGAWWYFGFSSTVEFFLSFAKGTGASADDWALPWDYYFRRTFIDLGPMGAALCAAGFAALALQRRPGTPAADASCDPVMRLWPAALLVPTLAGLSAISGKIPWLVNCLFGAWATVAALGLSALLEVVGRRATKPAAALAAALVFASLATTAALRDHTMEQRALGLDFWPSANRSRNLAERLNKVVGMEEPTLITTFHYLGEEFAKFPCPVFTYYLKNIPVVIRSYHIDGDYALKLIREHRIDWALLSPVPGEEEKKLIIPLVRQPGVTWTILDGAYLLRTTAVHTNQVTGDP